MSPASRPDRTNALRNVIFAALAPALSSRLLEAAAVRHVRCGEMLMKAGEPAEALLFPCGAVVSVTVDADPGKSIEVAMVGSEAVLGLSLIANKPPVVDAEVLHEGFIASVPADRVSADLQPGSTLDKALRLYAHVFTGIIAQSAACGRTHSVEERCARWLLTLQDRTGSASFKLTQRNFARMLGVRRASVTEAISSMTQRGLLRGVPGELSILDRIGLEQLTCRCYWVTKQQIESFTGSLPTELESAGSE